MRKSLCLWLLAICLSLAVLPCAFAQYNEDQPGKIVLRVGFYGPMGDLGDRGDSIWQAVGVDYVRGYDPQNRPITYFSLERATGDAQRFQGSITSLTYTRVSRKDESLKRTFYYGVSGGIYWIDTEYYDLAKFQVVSDSGLTLGASGIIGYDFNENYFVEGRYTLTGKAGGYNFTGYTIMFGIRNLF